MNDAPSGQARTASGTQRRRNPMAAGAWPLLFIGPLMLGVLVFYYFPILGNFYTSLTQTNAFGGDEKFVGFENYVELFARPDLPSATLNTLIYTAVVLLGVPISVGIASLLELPHLKGRTVYRMLFFMPYLAMPVAIVQVWRLVYNSEFGMINQVLRAIGVENPPHWLSTPGVVLMAAAVVGIWGSIGFNVIILSAGLKSIPKELYEAAALDGASTWHQFKSVTVPLLTPSIFFLMIMQAIAGFQLFDTLFALLGANNPAASESRSLVSLFYQEAFRNHDRGMGAAVTMVILALVGAVTAVQFWGQKKWVHYV